MIAFVAYRAEMHGGTVSDTELSGRFWAEQLRRSSDSGVSRSLRKLCHPPTDWLTLSRVSVGRHGHRYTLGPQAVDARDEWVRLGGHLFGPDGILSATLGEPLIKHGYLNVSGMLVLGALRAIGPTRRSVLAAALHGLLAVQTVYEAADRLVTMGIATSCDGHLTLVHGHDRVLIQRGIEAGVEQWALNQQEQHRQERHDHFESLAEDDLERQNATLRTLPCTYCGHRPLAGEGEVEHFPPLHWSDETRYTLRFPSCRGHNHWLGQQLRGSAPPTSLARPELTIESQLDGLENFTLEVALNEHALFTEALIRGDIDVAGSWSLQARIRLGSLRDGNAFGWRPDSGEKRRLGSVNLHKGVLARLDEHRHRIGAIRYVTVDSPFWSAGSTTRSMYLTPASEKMDKHSL